MKIFILLYAICMVILFLYNQTSNKKSKFLFEVILIMIFSLILGSRKVISMGDEYIYRQAVIQSIGLPLDISKVLNFEGAHYLLTWLVGNMFKSDQIYIFVTSLTIYGLLFDSFLKYTLKKNNYMVFTIFILSGALLSSLNVIRQYIAIAIIIYSLRFYKNKEFKKFIFLLFLAVWFHVSVMFIMPLMFLLFSKEMTTKHFLVLLSLTVLFSSNNLLESVISSTKYSSYVSTIGDGMGFFRFVFFTIQFLMLIFYYKKNGEKDSIYLNASYIAMSLNTASLLFLYASRLLLYFQNIVIIALPNIFYIFDKKTRGVVKIIFIVVYLVFGYYIYHGVNFYIWPIFS